MLEVPEQSVELAVAPHHRPVETARERRRIGIDGEDLVSPDGLGLSLQLQRFGRLGLDRIPHEAKGLAPDQRLTGRCRLLEPGSDVHRVAGDERLAFPRDDLARVDADPDFEFEWGCRGLHLGSRANGA